MICDGAENEFKIKKTNKWVPRRFRWEVGKTKKCTAIQSLLEARDITDVNGTESADVDIMNMV
jgi:hypothetical protein